MRIFACVTSFNPYNNSTEEVLLISALSDEEIKDQKLEKWIKVTQLGDLVLSTLPSL